MRLFSFASLVLLIHFQVHAAPPVVTAISGVSASNLVGTVTAYGGFAGTACTGIDLNTTCDNCAGAGLTACNSMRSYLNLNFRVTASHADTGNLILVKSVDNTMISTSPHTSATVAAPWSAICAGLGTGGISDCETSPTKEGTIKVCIDKDLNNAFTAGEECADVRVKIVTMAPLTYDIADTNNGIVNFTPYPGDEKIYLEDLQTSPNFPNLAHGGKITAVRVFIGEGNMTNAVPGAGLAPKELSVIEDGNTLDDSVVDGLTNAVPYWFRVGLVDEANNVGYFWPPSPHTDTNGKNCDVEACVYTSTPDEVVGLLTEDMNCFIASAAYGTSFNEKLDTFREFRFKKLLPTELGRRFVKAYYHYGPIAARFIHDKPYMRAAARGMLWPAYGFSRLALSQGMGLACFYSLFAMTVLIALPLLGVRRFLKRA